MGRKKGQEKRETRDIIGCNVDREREREREGEREIKTSNRYKVECK